ncbi:XRE family transcriptional regulator [Nocardia sp. NPDC058499]|uniref:XRE family transcriptional regulator n=1 Tax=Nocardia sp. NPDC058499 TaxID=3346530 RepID=UPI00365EDC5A
MLPGHTATELFTPDTTDGYEGVIPDPSDDAAAEETTGTTIEERGEVSKPEVIEVYPHRNSIPNSLWTRLLDATSERLDILVLAGLFLAEDPLFPRTVRQRTREGLQVRMLFGDPCEPEAAKRSTEERLAPSTVPTRIRNAMALVRPLAQEDTVDIRFHRTTLYNSIFRFDDDMIVNMHVYGQPGAYAPAMHLRRLPAGDLFATYMTSFEQVWNDSEPAEFEEPR